MNTLSAVILVGLLCGVVAAPRKWAIVSMVVGCLYLTFGASFDIAGCTVQPTRLLGYVCFFRVIVKREFSWMQLTRTDKAFVYLYVFTTLVLLMRAGGSGSMALAFAKMFDALLTYFAFRGLIRSASELRWLLGVLALLLVPYVAILAIERTTHHNLFDLVGGTDSDWIRGDKVRCFGSFRHPDLLGSLGACFLPLFIGLAWNRPMRNRAFLGAALCVAIVIFSNSGGPLSVMAVSLVGWLLWCGRLKMQAFRRSLVAMIILLAMVMKAPVWYLLARVSSFTGGTGWHRSYLIDVAFRHFDEWWLVGIRDEATASWFPYTLQATGGSDITNQYLMFGMQAGVVAIGLFIYVFYCAFSQVGHALACVRQSTGMQLEEPLLWSLGVTLAAHMSNWLGVEYFDQFDVLWLLQLAALVSLSEFCLLQTASNQAYAIASEGEDALPLVDAGFSERF
jgi:hypothetical protein